MANRPISLLHCLWGVPFLLIGFGLFTYILFHDLFHITDSLTQVVVPGKTELNLHGGLRYTVFLEENSVINGKIYSTPESITGLECHVTSLLDGSSITIEKPNINTTYNVNERSGHSVLEFPINKNGRYEFKCDYGNDAKGTVAVVSVGSGVGESIFLTITECFASIFGGFALCMIVVLTVLFKRNREIKRIRELELLAKNPDSINP
jgi:hypothetical protein